MISAESKRDDWLEYEPDLKPGWISVADRMPEPHTSKSPYLLALQVSEDADGEVFGMRRIAVWIGGLWFVHELGGEWHQLDEGDRIVAWQCSDTFEDALEVRRIAAMSWQVEVMRSAGQDVTHDFEAGLDHVPHADCDDLRPGEAWATRCPDCRPALGAACRSCGGSGWIVLPDDD